MMYLISDVHGQLADFKKLLRKIRFDSENDKLIILGDALDRGPDGILLLDYISPFIRTGVMELIMGNHELFAIMYLKGNMNRNTWAAFGGEHTLKAIDQLDDTRKLNLLNFLVSLPYYKEIDSPFLGPTVVCHTGIDCENYVYNDNGTIHLKRSIEKAVQNNVYSYMVGMDIHDVPALDRSRFDKYIVVGHVPCSRLNSDGSNSFYRTDYYMCIDAGAGHEGGILGCYCVDMDKNIYL